MSNLLKEKHALTSLRAKIERKKEKEYWSCKRFGYLAHNCTNKRKEGKRTLVPQNRFKVLLSRVMGYGIEI